MCQRCIKAGFECQGYGFRFAGSDSTRSFRRPIASGSADQQQPALTNAEVSKIIEELDSASSSTGKGPFSVLSFGHHVSLRETTEKAQRARRSSNLAIRQSKAHLPSSSSLSSRSTSTDSEDSSAVSPRSQSMTPPILVRDPPPLQLTPRQCELMEHWTAFVCNNMAPISGSPVNPYRSLYPALALQGVASTPGSGIARLAVFHAVCGTAAWSLSKLKPDDPAYHALSVNHDQLALQYIQESIGRPGGVRDVAVPAAIMACLTGDTISSRLDLWGRHLRGGLRSLLSVLSCKKRTESRHIISVLCQQYLLGVALGRGGTVADAEKLQGEILNEPLYLEECHCITREMLDTVVAINALAASSVRRQDLAETERVRQKLLHCAPTFKDNLRHHVSHTYYAAMQIYFTRDVLQSKETQHLASTAIYHLEGAREAGQGSFGQVLMWALLNIAPECTTVELQGRLLDWYNSQLGPHLGRLDAFMASLHSIWSRRRYPEPDDSQSRVEEIKSDSFISGLS